MDWINVGQDRDSGGLLGTFWFSKIREIYYQLRDCQLDYYAPFSLLVS
jgi:hypothetical protein